MKLTGTKVMALYLHSPTRLQVVLGPLRGMSTLLFAVDYVTFVRGWFRYFCSRLITLLLFMVDCVTCRGRMQCRSNTEEWRQGVVRYWSSAWRAAWRTHSHARARAHTHTHTQMKEERQRRQQNRHTHTHTHTHITYKHAHNAFIRYIGLRHFL